MRITNKMMSGNSLANINTNKQYLDKLNTQMATEKKITRPSDDPIIAIRALRLRSNLSEITQYYGANVPDAQAWVSVTQSAISSTKEMLSSLKSYADQGANGTNTASDRQKIYESMQALQKQIYSNGNATNAGRSVFTGYRTGEALTFKADTEAEYRSIWDNFNASDLTVNAYVEGSPSLDDINDLEDIEEADVKEDKVNRIRLSYDNIEGVVKKGVTAGWDGDEADIISTGFDYSTCYNEDGTLTTAGRSWSGQVTVDGGSETVTLTLHEPYDQGLDFDPEYLSKEISATVSGDSSEMAIKYGDNDSICTVTQDSSGNYSADGGASVKDNGDGTLTVTIPGGNGSMDSYTEITVSSAGTSVSVSSSKHIYRITDMNFYKNGDTYAHLDRNGYVYAAKAQDTTTMIYRTELTSTPTIDQDSIETDPVDGLQSFDLQFGGSTYTIQKYPDEDRWFALSGGSVDKTILVEQNSDKSFSIYDGSQETSALKDKTCNVFNVSANGKSVTSYYHQTALDVEITDSKASVASDTDGNSLTAYQYLALGADGKNSDGEVANKIYLLADTGELVFGSDIAKTLGSLKDIPGVDTISVIYDKTSFEEGDLRPEHYFDCIGRDEEHNVANPIVYDDHNQDINYTVGTNQSVKINTNAEDVFDTQIIREIDDILTAIDEYNIQEEKVNKLKVMQDDTTTYSEADQLKISNLLDAANKALDIAKNKLQAAFEDGITQFGNFFDQANLAETECGTVEYRLELVSNRLSEEKTTVTTLASENENVDITNIAVEVSEANLVYNAALMATGRISQQTLVDYI